ncbi:MAG TPA: OmpA family protein [Pseudoxanthomonas sp.]
MKHSFRIAAAMLFSVVLLSACGTTHVSRDISPQGVAGEVVFPSVDSIVLKEGTFPNVESLRKVGSGVTKDQLYYLLGRPHFREGYSGVREWDYLFHFRKDGKIITCQYKVIFDDEYRGQSFHWAPASCADVLNEEQATLPSIPPSGKRFELSGDALFAFNRHGENDILPDGRQKLSAIAAQLKQAKPTAVQVIGHTDRLGTGVSNLLLSQRRAATVRALLIQGGVEESVVSAQGMGEDQPVKQCNDDQPRAALVACLQPNRRVEIIAAGVE